MATISCCKCSMSNYLFLILSVSERRNFHVSLQMVILEFPKRSLLKSAELNKLNTLINEALGNEIIYYHILQYNHVGNLTAFISGQYFISDITEWRKWGFFFIKKCYVDIFDFINIILSMVELEYIVFLIFSYLFK